MENELDARQTYEWLINSSCFLIPLDGKQLLKKLDVKDSFFLYFGFASCPWCQQALPCLLKATEEAKLNIYYVDTHANEPERMNEYEQIKQRFWDYFRKDENGEKQLYTPLVLGICEGGVFFCHYDTLPGHNAFKRSLTPEEQQRLCDIYYKALKSHDLSK